MKFGICDNPQSIARLAPGTIDYIELGLSRLAAMSDEEFAGVGAQVRALGIPAETTNGFFPSTLKLTGPNYDRKAIKEYSRSALERAASLGIGTCVLGSGTARRIDEGVEPEEAKKQFDEAVVTAGDAAAEYGITIVLEPLNRRETNLLNTVSEGAVMCRRLKHPNVMLLADLYHFAVEKEPLTAITDNGDIQSPRYSRAA